MKKRFFATIMLLVIVLSILSTNTLTTPMIKNIPEAIILEPMDIQPVER